MSDATLEKSGGAQGAWRLVATREIIVRLTNKTFIISTIVTLLFLVGAAAFSAWSNSRSTQYTVAVTNDAAAAIVKQLDAVSSSDATTTVKMLPDDAAAVAAVKNDAADAYLSQQGDTWVLSANGDAPTSLAQGLGQVIQTDAISKNAAAVGTTPRDLLKGATMTVRNLAEGAVDTVTGRIATFAFAILFYMAALMFGQMIAASVIEEKQSRIVEIIAGRIPLRQLLAGKVVGNSVIALAQIVLYSAVGLVAMRVAGLTDVLGGAMKGVAWFVLFFAIGFLALAAMFAVAGALASRTEDLQSTTGPITIILVLVYMASFALDGVGKVIASYVPIASVIMMPARVLDGTAAWWEPIIALAILAAFAAGVLFLAERVYRRSLLQTGQGKLSWKQGLTAAE